MLPQQHRPLRSGRPSNTAVKGGKGPSGMVWVLVAVVAQIGLLLAYSHFLGLRLNDVREFLQLRHTKFRPAASKWLDDKGDPIQAHGGCILEHKGVFYFYGEDKTGPTYVLQEEPDQPKRYNPPRVDVTGVRCYSSKDLLNWKDEGLVLQLGEHLDLVPSRVLERPKVLYNQRHRHFVMWMHIDDAHYEDARVGVAVATSPTGPFKYLGSTRPHGEESRDLALFEEADGSRAYLVYATDHNHSLRIAELSDDYLGLAAAPPIKAIEGLNREAPALFKHQGWYYLLTSGCTGWEPNRAEVFSAPSFEGPWQSLGDPCRGSDPVICANFFESQATFVLPLPESKGSGYFIMMADRWNQEDLGGSGYIWLPLWVHVPPEGGAALGNGSMPGTVVVRWFDEWDRLVFNQSDTGLPLSQGGPIAKLKGQQEQDSNQQAHE